MTELTSHSPIHAELKQLGATWKTVSGHLFAVRLTQGAQEDTVLDKLAICDISGLPTWTVKGAGAEKWLRQHQANIPVAIFATTYDLANGQRVVRTGNDEFLVELAPNQSTPAWVLPLENQSDEFLLFERQDAIFLVTGSKSYSLLVQTCGINWDTIPLDTLVMTRVAGVTCGITRLSQYEVPRFQVRCDSSYATYLWGQLITICNELGGQPAGAELMFPEWFSI